MSDLDPVDDAIENIITLANCWLTLLPRYDCNTTHTRVEEVVHAVLEDITEPHTLNKAEYQALMDKTSFLLRDWLKFEHQMKPLVDFGLNNYMNMGVKVSVADLKDASKKRKLRTPIRTPIQFQHLVVVNPFGHLMAHCADLESSPIDESAVAKGEIELDEDGKITRFTHPIDLRRYAQRGRKKFERALVEYIQATFSQDEEA